MPKLADDLITLLCVGIGFAIGWFLLGVAMTRSRLVRKFVKWLRP